MANDELERYREYLKFLAKNNSPDIFTNENTDHAATVLTEMFNNASFNAVMLCHKLSDDIFTTEYKAAFESFIKSSSDHKVKILVKSDANCNEGFFRELLNYDKSDVEIRVIKQGVVQKISDDIGFDDCDFAVFDGKMFRLEYDSAQRKSIGSFNDAAIASTLTSQFEKYFDDADKCDITKVN